MQPWPQALKPWDLLLTAEDSETGGQSCSSQEEAALPPAPSQSLASSPPPKLPRTLPCWSHGAFAVCKPLLPRAACCLLPEALTEGWERGRAGRSSMPEMTRDPLWGLGEFSEWTHPT